MVLPHKLEAAVLADLRSGVLIGYVQLDILYRMAQSPSTSIADGDVSIYLNDISILNLVHSVGTPLGTHATQVGVVRNDAQGQMLARATGGGRQGTSCEHLHGHDGAAQHDDDVGNELDAGDGDRRECEAKRRLRLD